MSDTPDLVRRFAGVSRLHGESSLDRLKSSHVVIVGVGGVGSWAAEALARNAVGTITLVDLDNVAESNVNRQIHALDGNFGQAKVTAMSNRILQINPVCIVKEIEDFITPDNIEQQLDFHYDVILDCTDDAKAKVALAAYCKQNNQSLVMSGSAGGRLDATKMQVADLSKVTGDKLLAKVRNQLRRDHRFPKARNIKKSPKIGVACVYSDEQVIKPTAVCDEAVNESLTGLNCAGYGSSVTVTAPFGFIMAQLAINHLLA